MSKNVKAINLVWEAQLLIVTLHSILVSMAAQKPGKSSEGTLAVQCKDWLDKARALLHRKGAQ